MVRFGKVVVTREAYKSAGGQTEMDMVLRNFRACCMAFWSTGFAMRSHAKGLAESMAQRSLRCYIILCSIKLKDFSV